MMTPHEKLSALEYLKKAWQEIEKLPTITPCQNCFQLSAGFCKLYNCIIPEDVLPNGCDKFSFDPQSPPF